MGFPPSLDTYGLQDIKKKPRQPARLLFLLLIFLSKIVKKKIAKKPFLCYDVSVEFNHRKEGLFNPPQEVICYDDCIKNRNF